MVFIYCFSRWSDLIWISFFEREVRNPTSSWEFVICLLLLIALAVLDPERGVFKIFIGERYVALIFDLDQRIVFKNNRNNSDGKKILKNSFAITSNQFINAITLPCSYADNSGGGLGCISNSLWDLFSFKVVFIESSSFLSPWLCCVLNDL